MPKRSKKASKSANIVPQPMDVLLGRGKSNRKNPGNQVFQGTYSFKAARVTGLENKMNVHPSAAMIP